MANFPYLAPLYALCSALLFALSNHFSHIGLDGSDARSGVLVSIATSAIVYWVFAPFFLESWYWATWAAVLFAAVGIIRPSISSALAISSVKIMGPTLTSALTTATPLFGSVGAILLLGETLTMPIVIGTLAVIAGAVVASWRSQAVRSTWPLWALLLPLGASLIRATGHVVTKHGLVELPSPSFAVMVSNTVSLAVAIIAFKWQGRPVIGTPRSHLWFCAAGVANALSLQFLNSALQVGELVSVIPIVSATPVFTMLLGFFVFGREQITARTVATIALIVPGVVIIALNH